MIRVVVLAIIAVLFLDLPAYAQNDGKVVIKSLLSEVQKSLIRVRDAREENDLPPLRKVTLKLNSSLTREVNGKVSLFIIELGANVAEAAVQEIVVELEPPRPSDESEVADVSDALADAIIQTAIAIKEAERAKPPLHLSKLTATVRFVVTVEGGGGAKFEILPVTLDIGGKVNSVSTQEAIVEFSYQ